MKKRKRVIANRDHLPDHRPRFPVLHLAVQAKVANLYGIAVLRVLIARRSFHLQKQKLIHNRTAIVIENQVAIKNQPVLLHLQALHLQGIQANQILIKSLLEQRLQARLQNLNHPVLPVVIKNRLENRQHGLFQHLKPALLIQRFKKELLLNRFKNIVLKALNSKVHP